MLQDSAAACTLPPAAPPTAWHSGRPSKPHQALAPPRVAAEAGLPCTTPEAGARRAGAEAGLGWAARGLSTAGHRARDANSHRPRRGRRRPGAGGGEAAGHGGCGGQGGKGGAIGLQTGALCTAARGMRWSRWGCGPSQLVYRDTVCTLLQPA